MSEIILGDIKLKQRRNLQNMIRLLVLKIKKSGFIKFLFVGIINTIFGYSVFAMLIILRLDYRYALLMATIFGVMFNFKTIGILVFKTKNNELIFRFIGVYCVIYILNIELIKIINSFGINILMSQALLLLPLAVTSYILNKRFVFNGNNK